VKFIKYSKYVPDPFDGLSTEELLSLLQDFLLDSGFYNSYYGFQEMNGQRTMEELHRALLEVLREQGKIPNDLLQQMLQNWEDYQNSELAEAINKLLERLAEEGYVTIEQPQPGQQQPVPQRQAEHQLIAGEQTQKLAHCHHLRDKCGDAQAGDA
jgi:Ca-activated chloride channel family protein